MAETHLIIPFEGVDEIRFGMTAQQVAEVAGPPDVVQTAPILKRTYERRGASQCTFEDATGELSAISIYRPGRGREIRERLDGAPYVPALVEGEEVLDKKGFAALCERFATTEGAGRTGVLLPDLGIVVAGFRKRVPEGAYVIAFRREKFAYYETWLEV